MPGTERSIMSNTHDHPRRPTNTTSLFMITSRSFPLSNFVCHPLTAFEIQWMLACRCGVAPMAMPSIINCKRTNINTHSTNSNGSGGMLSELLINVMIPHLTHFIHGIDAV